MKALLRRIERTKTLSEDSSTFTIGEMRIDPLSRRVWREDELIQLTFIEFELLLLLASNPGRTFDRKELLEMVLGYTTGMHDDALTVHFSKLRSKIEKDPKAPVYLLTVRGVGYRFMAPDEYQSQR